MIIEPVIQHRGIQHYIAIATRVGMNEIPALLPPLFPKLNDWLNHKNLKPGGAPFFRYLAMNENFELDVEVGIPVDPAVEPDGEVVTGFFPEGSYVVTRYTGDYKNLRAAHMQLDDWIKEHGWKEHFQETPAHPTLGVRTEFYITDPNIETDPGKWITEIVMLVAEDAS